MEVMETEPSTSSSCDQLLPTTLPPSENGIQGSDDDEGPHHNNSGNNTEDNCNNLKTDKTEHYVNSENMETEGDKLDSSNTSNNLKSILTTPTNSSGAFLTPSSSSVKKSNLRKVSKYENLSDATLNGSFLSITSPRDRNRSLSGGEDCNPRKRIRIVEYVNQNNEADDVEDAAPPTTTTTMDEDDVVVPLEELELLCGQTHQTFYGDEEMVWVSPPKALLDFSLIHEDIVRAARLPVTKKFSVEIDMHFIDGHTITSLLDCKQLVIDAGYFNYEQVCRKELAPIQGNQDFVYPLNASNLQCLDKGLNFDLVIPQECLVDKEKVFYFADIWVTSKGFREYIMKKSVEYINKGIVAKGFAIQDASGQISKDFNSSCGLLFSSFNSPLSRYQNDEELASLPIELVEHFKPNNYDRHSFDICEIFVSDDFVRNILSKTDGKGVHLMVADNPECLNVHETVREVRFQRKFYAQCVMALLGVREGGTFIVKIFDAITLFNVGLIFLLHRCFKDISIHKPKTSPGHSSERFLICKGKLVCDTSDDILQFLLICHNIVMKPEEVRKILRKKIRRRLETHLFEVKQLVPLKVIIGHADFFEFLRLQNIRFTKCLVDKIKEICSQIPINCSWKLRKPIICAPEEPKQVEEKATIPFEEMSRILLKICAFYLVDVPTIEYLTKTDLEKISNIRNEWVVFPYQNSKDHRLLFTSPVTLFVGLGGDDVYYLKGSQFIRIKSLRLTKGTVLFGQIVEVGFLEEGVVKSYCYPEFRIWDGMCLNGKSIQNLAFDERIKLLNTYASMMNKSNESEYLKFSTVIQPVVLEINVPVFSSSILQCIKNEGDDLFYPDKMQLSNNLPPDETLNTAILIGGFIFYNKVNQAEKLKWIHSSKSESDQHNGAITTHTFADFKI